MNTKPRQIRTGPQMDREVVFLMDRYGTADYSATVRAAIHREYNAARAAEGKKAMKIEVVLNHSDLSDYLEEAECGATEAMRRYCRAYEALIEKEFPGASVNVEIGHPGDLSPDTVRIDGDADPQPGGPGNDWTFVGDLAERLGQDWAWLSDKTL
jgi:hypothetical protein